MAIVIVETEQDLESMREINHHTDLVMDMREQNKKWLNSEDILKIVEDLDELTYFSKFADSAKESGVFASRLKPPPMGSVVKDFFISTPNGLSRNFFFERYAEAQQNYRTEFYQEYPHHAGSSINKSNKENTMEDTKNGDIKATFYFNDHLQFSKMITAYAQICGADKGITFEKKTIEHPFLGYAKESMKHEINATSVMEAALALDQVQSMLDAGMPLECVDMAYVKAMRGIAGYGGMENAVNGKVNSYRETGTIKGDTLIKDTLVSQEKNFDPAKVPDGGQLAGTGFVKAVRPFGNMREGGQPIRELGYNDTLLTTVKGELGRSSTLETPPNGATVYSITSSFQVVMHKWIGAQFQHEARSCGNIFADHVQAQLCAGSLGSTLSKHRKG
jgi:hypothetical protein